MADEHQVWLPPRAPAHPPDTALPRAPGAMPRRQRPAVPTSPGAVAGVGLGAASVLVTLFSLGASFAFSAVFAAGALYLGRRTGRRAAVVLGVAGLALACVAGVTWMLLAAHGITPQDLQGSLTRALDRARAR